ncbi:hypothetical protein C6381_09040 [Pseudomonas syringae pv. actinidiae]|nr:hypothetical protein C6381_09040 [Pseudomonas syringae pv. actinidiae]
MAPHSGQIMMIGESQSCDRDDPRKAGIQGFYLDRDGNGDFNSLVDFADAAIHTAGIQRG